MYKRRPPKPIDYLDRVVPNSTKYSHIQGVLNTGVTIHKVKTVNAKEISKRRDEVFYRIGKHSLAELYSEYEMESHESITNPSLSYDPSAGGPKILTYDEGEIPRYEKPYLILDVREAMDYNKGHLLQSRSYPYAMMRRDYTHPELYNFRNKEGMLIIMYCDDEKISTEAAFVLVQRGYDNVYVLTGGLFEFANHYMSFIEGEVNMPKGSPSKPTRAPTARRSGTLLICCFLYRQRDKIERTTLMLTFGCFAFYVLSCTLFKYSSI